MQNNAASRGGEGRERGGIISWIGRPSRIRTSSLVFSSTDGQGGREEARGGDALQHPSLCPCLVWVVKTIAKPLVNLHDGRFIQSKSDHISEMPFVCPIRDPSASPQGVNKVSRDPNQRIRSLSLLVQQIKTYYQVRPARSLLCLRPGLPERSARMCQPLPSVRPSVRPLLWSWQRFCPCGSTCSS